MVVGQSSKTADSHYLDGHHIGNRSSLYESSVSLAAGSVRAIDFLTGKS
jgi:hypothetical protein